mgnify:CR=1 FL=1|tara:strand:- start:659 stop:2113 length:1455 start_codon:yes stop_codon:yes gene_type:complete
MDVIELSPDIIQIDDLNPENDSIENIRPSVNFGTGIELLMNDKKNEKSNRNDSNIGIDINDISKLEDELNDLTSTIDNNPHVESKESDDTSKKLFGNIFTTKKDGSSVKEISDNEKDSSNLGKATSNMNENKTWDGYGKFNNVPVNLDKTNKKPELTHEEELKEKFKYLRKLEELEKKGVSLSKRYNMDSNLEEMIGEYETIIAEKERTNSVKFQGKMMMAFITGIEFLNNKFDPFDVKLDGWGEQINENIEEYDDIFGELHEKYKSKAKMSPELKLLFQLGGSAVMVHMSNTLFKSAMPGMDDIMRQNPELMKQFTSAAVNTMGNNGNPGFAGFMNNMFGGPSTQNDSGLGFGGSRNMEMPEVINEGPLPEPVETKLPDRSKRVANIPNRPDIMTARGGVSINNNQGDVNNEERIARPEMRGPSTKQNEINSLLNNIKQKQVNVDNKESSTISVEDLKDLHNAKLAKPKRKQKSDKNIVSLDI